MDKTEEWKSSDGRTFQDFKDEVRRYTGLVSVAEIAERAGVKPNTVSKWLLRHDDFPEPAAELAIGPVWIWDDIEPWVRAQAAKGPGRPSSGE